MKGSSAIEDFTTTEIAKIDFDPHERFNVVRIFAYKPRMMGAEVEGGADWVPFTYEFGSLLGDDIKFKKIDEMKRIQADPIRFYPIEKLATDTYKQLKIELLAQDIKRRLAPFGERGDTSLGDGENGRNSYDLLREPNSVRFTADQCDVRDSHIELSGKVLVTEYETDSRRPLRTLECTGVSLHLEGDELTSTLTMDIQNAEDAASAIVIMWPSFRGLILPQPVQDMANQVMTGNGSLKTEELTRELSGLLGSQPSEKLTSLQERLRRDMLKTLVEIKAEIHSRLVFGTGCVPMILIGMGLGIIRKGGHLLTAFGASCIPAAVLIVCIMSGKQLTKNLGAAQTVSGETVMWAGLVFLSLLVVIIYGRLLRH
jgi:hypothetical protein